MQPDYSELLPSETDGIRDGAAQLITFLREKNNLRLSFDEGGVIGMAVLIEKLRNADVDPESLENLQMGITYFLGECVNRNFQSRWVIHERQLALLLKDGALGFPEVKVMKQFENGEEDNIHGFYRYCRERSTKEPPVSQPQE